MEVDRINMTDDMALETATKWGFDTLNNVIL